MPTDSPTVSLAIQYLLPAWRDQELRMLVHPGSETISNFLRIYGVWQWPLTVFIARMLRPGDVFVDVGANMGYFSLIAAKAVGAQGRVVCFEPEPENFRLLERNRALNEAHHMVCHQVALSDQPGQATLHRSARNRGAHSLLAKPGMDDAVAVPVTTLDLALAGETRPPRLVKIDVQGLDLQVLRGMAGLLETWPQKPLVLMEFAPREFEVQDPGLEGFRTLVERFGYGIHAFIANERSQVTPPRLSLETLLAIHRDFLARGEDAEFDILLAPAG